MQKTIKEFKAIIARSLQAACGVANVINIMDLVTIFALEALLE
jgi:hypothetical protein